MVPAHKFHDQAKTECGGGKFHCSQGRKDKTGSVKNLGQVAVCEAISLINA
jgi:hypothetical protein